MRHDTIRDDVRVNLWMLFIDASCSKAKKREKRGKEAERGGGERKREE